MTDQLIKLSPDRAEITLIDAGFNRRSARHSVAEISQIVCNPSGIQMRKLFDAGLFVGGVPLGGPTPEEALAMLVNASLSTKEAVAIFGRSNGAAVVALSLLRSSA